MIEFLNITIKRNTGHYENTKYFTEVMFLYLRYAKFLDDDYALNGQSF